MRPLFKSAPFLLQLIARISFNKIEDRKIDFVLQYHWILKIARELIYINSEKKRVQHAALYNPADDRWPCGELLVEFNLLNTGGQLKIHLQARRGSRCLINDGRHNKGVIEFVEGLRKISAKKSHCSKCRMKMTQNKMIHVSQRTISSFTDAWDICKLSRLKFNYLVWKCGDVTGVILLARASGWSSGLGGETSCSHDSYKIGNWPLIKLLISTGTVRSLLAGVYWRRNRQE